MKLYFPTEAQALKRADEMHAWLIASDEAYAKSAAAGQTTRWTVPAQDPDEEGKPIGSDWFIVVKGRVMPTMKPAEASRLRPHDEAIDGRKLAVVKAERAEQARAEQAERAEARDDVKEK